MPAKVIPLTDLAKAVDEALLRVVGKGRPGGPIILGRVIKNLEGNPAAIAKRVTADVSAQVKGLKATPTVIPGPGGTTIGFVIRPTIEKL